jgi:hypothetical protein
VTNGRRRYLYHSGAMDEGVRAAADDPLVGMGDGALTPPRPCRPGRLAAPARMMGRRYSGTGMTVGILGCALE